MTIIFIILAVLLLAFLIYWLFGSNTDLQTVSYTVPTDKLAAPVRIAVASDLHSCKYGENQVELLDTIAAQSPDAVLLTGDIYDDRLPDGQSDIFLRAAGERFRCYYIPGNHEFRKFENNNIEGLLHKISSYGITVLFGECESVTLNGNALNLCGLMENPSEEPFSEQALSELAASADNGCYTILLAHRPSRIKHFLPYDFDLIVAGHAHGGQWRIPGLLNGLIAPDEGLFPKYSGGKYVFDSTTMIVGRGLARESTIVPRIFNPPELVVIDILPKDT